MSDVIKSDFDELYPPVDYGDLELPDFNDVEEKIRNVELDFDSCVESGEMVELLKLKGSYALRMVDDVVGNYVLNQTVSCFSEGSTGLDDEFKKRIESALIRSNWSGVESESGEYFVLGELTLKAHRLKFQLIQKWLDECEDTGFTPVAELEYECIMPAMSAADEIYLKIITEKPPIDSDERKERGFTNECAIVREIGGKVVEVPLGEAFPEEIYEIVHAYEGLLSGLEDIETDDEDLKNLIAKKHEYYTHVQAAFLKDDIDEFKKADELIAGQVNSGDDVMHIHNSEVGYMKDRIVRSPEISLRAPDLDSKEAQELTVVTKETMIHSFEASEEMKGLGGVQMSLALLKKSNAALRHFLGGGIELDFRPAGQILPNDLDSRIKGGVDSSLDLDSVIARLPLKIEATNKVFGKGFYEKEIAHRASVDYMTGVDIASHELGHAVGLVPAIEPLKGTEVGAVPGTNERLGESTLMGPFIEEWKATVAGMMGVCYLPYLAFEEEPEVLRNWLMSHIANACRMFSMRNISFAAAYVRKSMMLMKVAEDTGCVAFDENDAENPWKPNLRAENVKAFFEKVNDQFVSVMNIYEFGTEENLNDFLHSELQESKLIDFMFSRLDVPNTEDCMAVDMAKLPIDIAAEKAAKPDPTEMAKETGAYVKEVVDGGDGEDGEK